MTEDVEPESQHNFLDVMRIPGIALIFAGLMVFRIGGQGTATVLPEYLVNQVSGSSPLLLMSHTFSGVIWCDACAVLYTHTMVQVD